jgi:translation elongation factor EF-Tu-like GTPase
MGSGYRSQLRMERTGIDVGFEAALERREIPPGGVGRATIATFAPIAVRVGQAFEIREGSRVVGAGLVLSAAGSAGDTPAL